MAQIKTVQLPVDVWEKLRDLARNEDRSIASFLRSRIVSLHYRTFTKTQLEIKQISEKGEK
jgi:hypothetical protein